jgi:hypothetical protein
MTPVRIQRRRAEGYDMQAASRAVNGLPCISVTRPGRWGNPFDVRGFGRELAMKLFRSTMEGIWDPSLLEAAPHTLCDAAYAAHHAFLKRIREHPGSAARSELSGNNLGCYCKASDACHADILLEYAQACSVQSISAPR